MARALEEAHGLGIVHRDLKPSNIMLVGDGNNEVAKVLDFGIAKLVTGADANTLLTDAGMAVGTPKYMSPEQAIGGHVDYRSDLYSMGVILYELLAGLHPFHGGTPSVEIPIPVERLLNCLMAKRPGDRPRGIVEVTSELAALQEGSYDPRTTRMPRMSTSPGGLRQIVEGELDTDDIRLTEGESTGLEDVREKSSSEKIDFVPPEKAEDERRNTSEGMSASEGPVAEETEDTEDYTGDGVEAGDATPLYQKKISSKGSGKGKGSEDWRDEEHIPMDGRDEWTTTSRHIPRVDADETEPPDMEWDAPAPDWERPPPV